MPAAQKASSKVPKSPAETPPAAGALKKGDHLFLVDGSGYIFRAYHALPPINRKSDGLQLNAVFGFCNMLWKLLRDMKPEEKPTHLGVVFDLSERTFRTEMYPDYKAHRPDPPDDLRPQFPLIRQAVAAFDLPCLEQRGFEADDLIATYVRQACEAGAISTIVSSDKDLMQLVTDGVIMFDTMKDKRIGRAEVIEKFGVPPDKVIEVQALIGDSTDNVPGVPGIGVKTAAQLIGEYGDLETLLKRAPEIKQEKRRQALIDNAELARLSKKLVTLDGNVTLDVPIGDLAVHEPDYKRLIAFLRAMEFSSLTRRVGEFAEIDPSDIEPDTKFLTKGASSPSLFTRADDAQPSSVSQSKAQGRPAATRPSPANGGGEVVVLTPKSLVAVRLDEAHKQKFDRSKYETVRDAARLQAWVERARTIGVVAIDTETSSLDPMQAELCGFSLAVVPNEACYVPLAHRHGGEGGRDSLFPGEITANQLSESAALEVMKPLLEDQGVLKIGQNLKFDWQIFARRGVTMTPYDDTMLMSYVADAGRSDHGLDPLARRYFDHETIDFNEVTKVGKSKLTFDNVDIAKATEYAAEDADATLRLWQVLKPRLAAEKVLNVYETLERPLLRVLADMERRGISVDRQMLSRLSGEFAHECGGLQVEINKLAGDTVNVGSPKQIGDILFGKMQLPGGTKTKTGQWATGARQLEELAELGHELPQKILDWRQVSKLKSTYTDALPGYVNPTTHRVHTSYALASTTTGRLSSSEPNLQNIPIRTEDGRKIRRAFVAAPGHKLVSADYSQIELRLLAEIADIPQLRKAFKDGLDIHAMTASEMFGVPVKDMPADVRRRAKAINFGIIYGISAFGLANQLSIAREEAGAYIKKYFERFPGIRDYMEETKAFAKKHGYVLTLFGRKCHYPDIGASNASIRAFNERAAINARLQGTAADIIRRAMVRMDGVLEKAKLSAQMLLQVHDELVFEVPAAEVDRTLPVVTKVMVDAPMPALSLAVPLHVEAHGADNWDAAH
ncbi:MAG TPA: DNA polymerase I [Xanthobacteraceae bacterium]|jgi:DNA polymerase-1|nr:DNA polymerase I [Xanthobacteraceae bacterium]